MENSSNQEEKLWKKNSGNIDEKIINYIDSLKIDNKFDKVNHEKYLESISKSNNKDLYFKLTLLYIEYIRKSNEILKKEFFTYIYHNIKYINEFDFEKDKNKDLLKDCESFVLNSVILFEKYEFDDNKDKDLKELHILISIVIYFLPSIFCKEIKEKKKYSLLLIIKGLLKINEFYSLKNIYLLNCINEFTFISFYKMFELDKIKNKNLKNFMGIYEQLIIQSINKDYKFIKMNLSFLFLIYRISLIEQLESTKRNINPKEEINKNNLEEEKKKKKIQIISSDKFKTRIVELFNNYSLNINLLTSFLLDILIGNFFQNINLEKNQNHFKNYFTLKNFIICSPENINKFFIEKNNENEEYIKNSEKKCYQFLLNENEKVKYDIKESIILGILDILSTDFYKNFFNGNLGISLEIIISKFKDLILDENSYFKENSYKYFIRFFYNSFLYNVNRMKKSLNNIIDILLFMGKNYKLKETQDELVLIETLIFDLFYHNLNLERDKFVKLFELIPINSLIMFGYCLDFKILNNDERDIEIFINLFLNINNNQLHNSFILIIFEKLKKQIKQEKKERKTKLEYVTLNILEKTLDIMIKESEINKQFIYYIIEIIIFMNFDNFSKIINIFFLNKYHLKNNLKIIEILYEIFWALNYSFQKDKMKQLLNIFLEEGKFDLIIPHILNYITFTHDDLIHLKNNNKFVNKFKFNPIPLLIIKQKENSNFIFFDLKNILNKYLEKNLNSLNEDILKIISKYIKSINFLNENSMKKIHHLFSNLNLEKTDYYTLEIYYNLNYFFSWLKIESFSFFNIEEKKDSLFDNLLKNIEKIPNNLNQLIIIYCFYINTLFENNFEINIYIEKLCDLLISIYQMNKTENCILLNLLFIFSFLKEIIKNFDNIYHKIVLIISLISFPENEFYLTESFYNNFQIKLPEKNEKYILKELNEEKKSLDKELYIKNFAVSLLLIYYSYSSKKTIFIQIYQNIENNFIKESNFCGLLVLENNLKILKKENISIRTIEQNLSGNEKQKGFYVLFNNNILISFSEKENQTTLLIINKFYSFQYIIDLSNSLFNNLTEEKQIEELTIILNNNKKENIIYYNSNYQISKENISKYILEYIINLGENKNILSEIKEISKDKIDSLYYLIQKIPFPMFNIYIIYQPFSLNQNLNEEVSETKTENYSKEFINCISKLGNLEIDKKTNITKIFFEDNNKMINLFLYDTLKKSQKDKINTLIKLKIIWIENTYKSLKDYLENCEQNKFYIFIFPKDDNLYEIKLRYKNLKLTHKNNKDSLVNSEKKELKNYKQELQSKYIFCEEILKEFLDEYFFKDIIINLNSESGIRYFKNLLVLLSSIIHYCTSIIEKNKFYSIEDERMNIIKSIIEN